MEAFQAFTYSDVNNNKTKANNSQAVTIYNTKDSHYKVFIKLRLLLDFNESNTEYDVLMNFPHYLIVIKAILKAILIIKHF